jgi:hypothetical protein
VLVYLKNMNLGADSGRMNVPLQEATRGGILSEGGEKMHVNS